MNYVALSSHVTSAIDSGRLGMSKGSGMGTVGRAGDRGMNNYCSIHIIFSVFRLSRISVEFRGYANELCRETGI